LIEIQREINRSYYFADAVVRIRRRA